VLTPWQKPVLICCINNGDNKVDGDGATGDEVKDDGNGAMGIEVDDDGYGATDN
jgi:hypothetical protein